MKLLEDNVRNVLLDMEEHMKLHDDWTNEDIMDAIRRTKISSDDYVYTIDSLLDGGYIIGKRQRTMDGYIYMIKSISFSGHQFLDTVRSPEIWRQTKSLTSKFEGVTIEILSQVTTNLISKQLGLN
ncbi:DUF2513 domain-containing protein [Weissella confusa]|uniref:DUF2513 domain-containing protein n=1 Tax=Weissella confusa TaxID=1583 RepID=UPI0018F2149C|nr:DUF2513 domain-containing protein [Weissella confusa]MBJ7657811.1 DUF2513 domain-containing protein [Weissella confusa]